MILFFIRSFNDIDHLAPIVYRLAKEEETVRMLCQDPEYNITNDFRLKHLTSQFNNVTVQYVYEAYVPTTLHRFLVFIFGHGMHGHSLKSIISPLFLLRLKSFFQRLLGIAFRKCVWERTNWNEFLCERLYGEDWALQCLKRLQATVVVFDYVISEKQFVTNSFLKAAGRLGIPSIGVAPGVPIFAQDYFPEDELFAKEAQTSFNYNAVPHKGVAEFRIKHGVDADSIQVLGSPRFCSEWQMVLEKIVPPSTMSFSHTIEKLKVVYMERGADLHGKFRQVIEDTISRLSCLDFMHLIIKPHPRNNCFHMKKSGSLTVVTQENSLNLINWTDVVIGTNTSILIDVLIRSKVLLYPKYFHADRMIFDEMEACVRLDSYDELETTLRHLHADRNTVPYPKENVTRLIDYLVYGGIPGRDVLGDYTRFLKQVRTSTMQKFE